MAAVEARQARTYGNFRQPEKAGIGTLPPVPTAVLLGGFVFFILSIVILGVLKSLPILLVTGILVALLAIRDKHHRNAAQRATAHGAWWRARRLGAHLYRSGPLGRTPWGTFQLPGLASNTQLFEHLDSLGRRFALIRAASTNHYTVAFAVQPEGNALVDDEQVDNWVANWGAWLATVGDEPGVVGAQVTVETSADTGSRLRREVAMHADPNAPAFAQAVLAEAARTYPAGSATVKAIVTLTFTSSSYGGGRRRSPEEMGRDLASRLPALVASLNACGAGGARPMSAQKLCEAVRIAYDPAAAQLIDDAHAAGEVLLLRWSDVGPVASEASWDSYRHDSALSMSWVMSRAPRGEVYSTVLAKLLSPHHALTRKRVTLLYRPYDSGRAAAIAEMDKRQADSRVYGSRRPSQKALLQQRAAAATAREEAVGAGLVDFGMIVTATVSDAAQRAEAVAAIDSLQSSARVLLRPAYGAQDSTFAGGLPLGIILSEHVSVPEVLKGSI
ncbi:SCO6880 family protein [Kineococcus sp. SYSU DK006]|uniref:SCO6880 family protein n=1 Tax=Kineococcus sp. SYSU DK006 TaxID=3383127 RepID=UPI003D7CC05E